MKKILAAAGLVCVSLFAAGCGNGWELTKKNFKSDYSELYRTIKVYDSFTKDVLWEYTGVMYLSDASKPGNVSIVYKKAGKYYKNDFVGQHIQVVLTEIPTSK